MEKLSFHQRLKWVAAILCALLFPILGMVVFAGVFWSDSLTTGIAVGGIIGVSLYLRLLWHELKLKEHWVPLALSFPLALLPFVYLWEWQNMPEMAMLMLIYIPVCVTMIPLLSDLDKKSAASPPKPSRMSPRIGVVALIIWAVILFFAGQSFPMIRPLTDSFLRLFAVAVLFAVIAFFARIFFKHVENGAFQRANHAYQQECDPRPMLEECERRLSNRISKTGRHRWLMQKAAMLGDLGDLENAVQIVNELLSAEQDLSVQNRWVCFYDLAEFHCSLGNPEAAVYARAKAHACASQCRSAKTKQWMRDTLSAQEGTLLYHGGEYEKAHQRMMEWGWDRDDTTQSVCTRVFRAYRIGLVLIKMGDTQTAMEKLRFVAEHGNQFAITTRAKELIS